MKRKVLAVLFAATLTAGFFAGCGSTDKTASDTTGTSKEDSEGSMAVDEKTAAQAVSEEEAAKAGFTDGDSSEEDMQNMEDIASSAEEIENTEEDSEEEATLYPEENQEADFSDSSDSVNLDTTQELTGTHHAEIVVKDYGDIEVELDADTAPVTVTNFVKLVQENFYDGLTFHRIMDGFMIQGGDPEGTGRGGADETIKGEFSNNGVENDISHTRGTISMARSTDPDSASSQFFIVQADAVYLDGDYAGFGHVTSGMDVVDKICQDAKPTDDNGTIPAEEQPVIESIRMID